MRRVLPSIRLIALALLGAALASLAAMRAGWVRFNPELIAIPVIALCAWMLAELGWTLWQLWRHRLGPLSAFGRGALLLGGLGVLGGGLANWAYSLQGMIVMAEGEAAPFFRGLHLQEFVSGPLSDVDEMNVTLYLDELELVPGASGEPRPVASLRLETGGQVQRFTLTPGQAESVGTLRFHLGQFGYAPKVVIQQGGQVLFDQKVPLRTQRDEDGIPVFADEFTVQKHGLLVRAEVSLDSLDPQLRGHPTLSASLFRDGAHLGSGELRLGNFAEVAAGHRIGFAGLEMWAEIDLARKHYPEPIFAGLGLGAAGLLLIAFSAWAARRRLA